jgi:hypothetical protein
VERVAARIARGCDFLILIAIERLATDLFADFWMVRQVHFVSVWMCPDGARGVRLGVYLVGGNISDDQGERGWWGPKGQTQKGRVVLVSICLTQP